MLLVGIVLFLQNCSNDYSKAKNFADSGNYKEFYSEISQDVKNGDKKAKNLLINYFFKAIQDSDLKQVQYFMQQQPQLINIIDDEGNRAIDVTLVDNSIRLEVLKFLLKYKPDLNYVIELYQDEITPLQLLTVKKESFKSIEAIKLLIDAGANVNFYTETGTASISPLLFSYLNDNIKVFNLLLKYGAELKNIIPVDKKNKNDILSYIAGSYALELTNNNINLQNFYEKPLDKNEKIAITSQSYAIINKRNIEYLNLMNKYKKLNNAGRYGMEKLAQFYAATNEVNGLKLLVSGGLCSNKSICQKLRTIALKNNYRAILYILNKEGK